MLSGMCNFCTNHLLVKFVFFEYIAYMTAVNGSVLLKQFRHLSLCKPYGLILQLYIKLGLAVIRLEYNNLVVEFLYVHFLTYLLVQRLSSARTIGPVRFTKRN